MAQKFQLLQRKEPFPSVFSQIVLGDFLIGQLDRTCIYELVIAALEDLGYTEWTGVCPLWVGHG